MRTRLTLLLAAVLITAVFVALNWTEFVRPTPVSLGFGMVDAPLPLILLGALLLALVTAMANAAWVDRRHETAMAQHLRELEAQRRLAESLRRAPAGQLGEEVLEHAADVVVGPRLAVVFFRVFLADVAAALVPGHLVGIARERLAAPAACHPVVWRSRCSTGA